MIGVATFNRQFVSYIKQKWANIWAFLISNRWSFSYGNWAIDLPLLQHEFSKDFNHIILQLVLIIIELWRYKPELKYFLQDSKCFELFSGSDLRCLKRWIDSIQLVTICILYATILLSLWGKKKIIKSYWIQPNHKKRVSLCFVKIINGLRYCQTI